MMLLISLLTSALAGAALGGVFFGLLWVTVRGLPHSRLPGLLLGLSYATRLIILVGGLLLIMAGEWWRLVAALAGLITMRTYLLRRFGPAGHPGAAASPGGE